jgi:hypothetical protein
MIRTAPFWYPGMRRLRVGEIMQEGDVMPDLNGTTQPIRKSMVGWPVLGRRSGEEDFVFRPRKRKEQYEYWKIITPKPTL